jgi:dynamin 1-like protein
VAGLFSCFLPSHLTFNVSKKFARQYINTSHPDFIGGSRAVSNLMERKDRDERRSNAVGGDDTPSSYYENAEGDEDDEQTRDNENGGIMNFIFRGGKTPPKETARGQGGPPTVVHLPQVPDTMKQTDVPPSDRELTEMHVIKSLIDSYFKVVRKNFIDMVPKTIMFFLVNHVKDALQNELVSELYREAEIGGLMKEAEDVAQRRNTCTEMRDLLGKALEIVNEVRDYNSFNQVE